MHRARPGQVTEDTVLYPLPGAGRIRSRHGRDPDSTCAPHEELTHVDSPQARSVARPAVHATHRSRLALAEQSRTGGRRGRDRTPVVFPAGIDLPAVEALRGVVRRQSILMGALCGSFMLLSASLLAAAILGRGLASAPAASPMPEPPAGAPAPPASTDPAGRIADDSACAPGARVPVGVAADALPDPGSVEHPTAEPRRPRQRRPRAPVHPRARSDERAVTHGVPHLIPIGEPGF